MKPFYLVLSFIVACFFETNAQSASVLERTVYFATGSSALDEASKKTLDEAAKTLVAWGDFEWEIIAYTDDRGSVEQNQKLAKARSQAVLAFFNTYNLHPAKQQVSSGGQMALLQGADVEEQRRRARRVEIRAYRFGPQNLRELFSYFQQKTEQRFDNIDLSRAQVLTGEQGCVLQLPAGCLENSNGVVPKGRVTVFLREMLTLDDMLRANLTTVSNGKLLETGGMVHIRAVDSVGNELRLRNGVQALLRLPAIDDPKGMQVFVADRPEKDIAATINWQPTNRPVMVGNLSASGKINPPKTPDFFRAWNKAKDELYAKNSQAQPFPSDIPREAPILKPVEPFPPKNLDSTIVEPTMEYIVKVLKRNAGESKDEFANRQKFVYQQELDRYNQQKQIQAKYQQELDDYAKQKEAYTAQQKRFAEYKARYYECLMLLDADNRRFVQPFIQRLTCLTTTIEYVNVALEKFKQSYTNTVQDIQKLGLQAEYVVPPFPALPATVAQKLPKDPAVWESLNRHRKMLAGIGAFLNRYEYYAGSYKPSDGKIYVHTYGKQNENKYVSFWDWQDNKQLDALQKLCADYQTALKNDTLWNAMSNFYEVMPALIEWYAQCEIIDNFIKMASMRCRQVRVERGLATDEEILAAGTALALTRFGWINCDRFINVTEDKTTMEIAAKPDNVPTLYYLVFKDMNSILPFKDQGAKGFMATGIPKKSPVMVVGLRVVEGKVEVFTQEGVAGDLGTAPINPVFHHIKIDELQALLESV